MELFNVSTDECLMIGDTTTDIEFGHNTGIKAVAVTFGAHSITKLQALHPHAIINDLGQLPEVIDNLCYSTQKSYQL